MILGARVRSASVGATLLVMLALGAVGCGGKKDETPPPGPRVPLITDAERKMGEDACAAYIDRVCKCGETKPDFKAKCALIKSRASALTMAMDVAAAEDMNDGERAQMQHAARKIIQKCIEQNSALHPSDCPR